jgi:hypothetical protein
MLSVDSLIALNQALVEEHRLAKELRTDVSRLDDELETKYTKLVDSSIRISCFTKALRTKQAFSLVCLAMTRTRSTYSRSPKT